VKFRENRRMWLDQVDRWLNRIKTHIQRFGGPPPADLLSCPAAVMAVRATVFPSLVRGIGEFVGKPRGMRRSGAAEYPAG
jgi:hypothetical protein